MTTSTMENQTPVRNILESFFNEKGYKTISKKDYELSENLPDKYVLRNAEYKTIYGTKGSSEFLLVNSINNLKLRVEIKIQQTSGSVDEKYPYLYLNSLTMHPDDVIIILEGKGFKPGAKTWLVDKIDEGWLNNGEKKVRLLNLVESIKYFEENL